MDKHNPNLQEIHDFLISVAKQAGTMITDATSSQNGRTLGSKKNSVDLVTETDRAVEDMISTTLAHKYPNYDFHGEETAGGASLTDSPTFIVDPIDGTTNFVHRFPNVCISLGFAISRVPVVGVVFNPFTNLLYTAIRGKGAFLNETTKLPLTQPPPPLTSLNECLVAVEWGSDRSGQNMECKVATFTKLARAKEDGGAMVHSLRSLGCAALNLCGVAAGSLDVYWEGGCYAWDVCAGWCILKETGGVIVDANPGGWQCPLDGKRYLAVRGETAEEGTKSMGKGQQAIIEEFWSYVPKDGFDYVAP